VRGQTERPFTSGSALLRNAVSFIACVHYEQGNIPEAERRFTKLLVPLGAHSDRVTEARVFANVACCRLAQDDLVGAEAFARRAMSMYTEFGMETEVTRTQWALAVAMLRHGDRDQGITRLETVADRFHERGLIVDAAEVELDIVAEYLRTGEHARAAAIVSRHTTVFIDVEARVSTARAFAYLREAALAARATPALVRAVRHVLTHPEQPFEPPS
jgi:ATP/maltotriose-dependent transcriptional regulator MalT